MRKWNVLAAILAVAFVVPTSFAQTQEDIQDLAARVAKLETENALLKSPVAAQNAAHALNDTAGHLALHYGLRFG